MSFFDLFCQYDWERVREQIYSCTSAEVETALASAREGSLQHFQALVSPAADRYLEEMASISSDLTRQRFGSVIQLYAPMYLSNRCQNICTYCGFSLSNKMPRKTLNDSEILAEAQAIKELGFDHVLLVTGEDNNSVGLDYFINAVTLVRPFFSQISIEVQPLESESYRNLSEVGVTSVLVYQETYNRTNYREFHPKGRKSNFEYRLDTPDRIASAEMHKIGIGALLGLEDWRVEAFFTALHLYYLERKFWKTRYSISFPRIRPASGSIEPKVEVRDRDLVHLICAYRLFSSDVELSLSTRESASFRDNAIKLGVTTISAGSKTDPGGYSVSKGELKQFEISDERSPIEMQQVLQQAGYQAVWKDWDRSFGVRL